MALKGKYLFAGAIAIEEAYVVIDRISLQKGGKATAFVEIYPHLPKLSVEVQKKLNEKLRIIEDVEVPVVFRGSPLEQFSVDGLTVVSQDPFTACYQQLTKHDIRFANMVSA